MLVRNVSLRGKHKIADRWEDKPYIVVSQPNKENPVYEVQREGSRSKVRVLHRNLLLPFMSITDAPKERDDVTHVDNNDVNTDVSRPYVIPMRRIPGSADVLPSRRSERNIRAPDRYGRII